MIRPSGSGFTWPLGLRVETEHREGACLRLPRHGLPATTTADEITALKPDGIMLSNGPGDPAKNTGIIAEIKKLCAHKIPTFGIC